MLDRTDTRPIRACLVTGSPATGRCGIHDYAMRLAEALASRGVDIEVLDQRDWSARGTLGLARKLARVAPDIVHMQYPMIVGWRSLGPQLTGFLSRARQILTLHEFTTFDRLRRSSLRAFASSADRIVMTTAFETARFLERFPGAGAKTCIIPIGSNIPFHANGEMPRGRRTIVFFGQIKPLKGLEEFIELVRIARTRGQPWDFQVIGAPVAWAANYLNDMRGKAGQAHIEWLLDRDDAETASLLSRASAAYLPYPDGASERRGSLIAALGNGLPVVTNAGEALSAELSRVLLLAADPGQAYAQLEALFADPALEGRLRAAGADYVGNCSWSNIADSYLDLYRQVCGVTALAEAAP